MPRSSAPASCEGLLRSLLQDHRVYRDGDMACTVKILVIGSISSLGGRLARGMTTGGRRGAEWVDTGAAAVEGRGTLTPAVGCVAISREEGTNTWPGRSDTEQLRNSDTSCHHKSTTLL